MNGAESTNYIRLVPLMDAVPDTERRQQILGLAAAGKVRLYTQVPPGLMAYAERHAGSEGTGHGSRYAQHSITLPEKLAIDQARREGRPVYPNPLPEVTFVALKSSDARTLLTSRSVLAQVFFHGLRFPPAEAHQPLDLYVPVRFPTMICLQTDADGHPPRPWVPPTGAQTLRLTWDDMHVDEQVPSRLKTLTAMDALQTTHALPNSADQRSGIALLHAAAKHLFAAPVEGKKVKPIDLEEWFKSPKAKGFKKLLTEENRRLAFKFIDPEHNPSQGARPGQPITSFDHEILDRAWKVHRKGKYVSDYLAVISLVADKWDALIDESEFFRERPTAERTLGKVKELEDYLEVCGFAGEAEKKSIVNWVIWPARIADLNAAMRPSKSQ